MSARKKFYHKGSWLSMNADANASRLARKRIPVIATAGAIKRIKKYNLSTTDIRNIPASGEDDTILIKDVKNYYRAFASGGYKKSKSKRKTKRKTKKRGPGRPKKVGRPKKKKTKSKTKSKSKTSSKTRSKRATIRNLGPTQLAMMMATGKKPNTKGIPLSVARQMAMQRVRERQNARVFPQGYTGPASSPSPVYGPAPRISADPFENVL